MPFIDSKRYREQLLLLSFDDDGFEDFILRLVREEYPDAQGSRRGRDGGIDVLSDYQQPPERAWQAKNYARNAVAWRKCVDSLAQAMANEWPPAHYTFVFPVQLKASDRNYWRDRFHPEQTERHAQLKTLDYWDDLEERLQDRPDLVNLLNRGALAEYMVQAMGQAGAAAVQTLGFAPAPAHPAEPAAASSERPDKAADEGTLQPAAGEAQPQPLQPQPQPPQPQDQVYASAMTEREPDAGDGDLPVGTATFTVKRGEDALPRYRFVARESDDRIIELAAAPRAGAEFGEVEPWFADSDEGEEQRLKARLSLAKAQPIDLDPAVAGLKPATVPERFRELLDDEGVLRGGDLTLGLSQPAELTITLLFKTSKMQQVVTMYRVPPQPGDSVSYAGAVGGTVIALNFKPVESGEPDERVGEAEFLMATDGEAPRTVLTGLGFVRAMGAAEQVTLSAPDLLGPEDWVQPKLPPLSDEAQQATELAATVSTALDKLNQRDGGERRMRDAVSGDDLMASRLVLRLLDGGEVRDSFTGQRLVRLPEHVDASLAEAMHVRGPAPRIFGEGTGLDIEQEVVGAEPVRFVNRGDGQPRLAVQSTTDDAAVLYRLITHA